MKKLCTAFLAGSAFLFFSTSAFAQGFDHSALDSFLKRHVDEFGQIDYSAAKSDRADLDRYLEQVKTADLKALQSGPKPEHLAFWLNVYHAGLIALILDHYPVSGSEIIPSFWERQFLAVGMRSEKDKMRYSLTHIRRYELSEFENEKVHLVLATASRSGPLFPRDAFTGPRVLGQIFKKTRDEVARLEMVSIDPDVGTVRLTQLFQWYAPDFIKNFGRPERRARLSRSDTAVVNFLIRYSKNIDNIRFLKSGNFKIEYFPYDWSLNDRSLPQ